MNTGDKVKEDIAKFQAQTAVQSNAFTPLKDLEVRRGYAKTRKKMLELFTANQYDELTKKMVSYSKADIEAFFLQEGKLILRWALTFTEDTKPLSFVVFDCNLNPVILKNTLRNEDYDILKSFLRGQAGLEKTSYFNQKIRDDRIERFKLLLKIDAQGVGEFMKENNMAEFVTEKIREDFSSALKQCANVLG